MDTPRVVDYFIMVYYKKGGEYIWGEPEEGVKPYIFSTLLVIDHYKIVTTRGVSIYPEKDRCLHPSIIPCHY
ncbi:MAG: hypothetical protein KIIPBIDF_01278 [Candidatus Methanoperedenaceae archaeon GB50]|nr:MAG: hypothetical protein KIIPBIDF_01278 [Candidatus Methanoperedenaceae archaeon GB50]